MKPISKLVVLIAIALLVSLVGIESALAADPPYWVNGSVRATAGGSALSGAIVVNTTNATQSDTTGADGFFNISGFYNSTTTGLTINGSGYTQQAVTGIIIAGADNNTYGTSSYIAMVPVTPTLSSAASASVTKISATVSWTVTATDNVNNNQVSNQAIWWAAGVENSTSLWSNTTTSPSFSLANLRADKNYTVYLNSYNSVNNSLLYYGTTSLRFSTLKAGMSSYYNPETGAYEYPNQEVQTQPPAQVPGKSDGLGMGSVAGGTSGSSKNTKTKMIIFVFMIVVVGLMAYYATKGSGKKGKGKR